MTGHPQDSLHPTILSDDRIVEVLCNSSVELPGFAYGPPRLTASTNAGYVVGWILSEAAPSVPHGKLCQAMR